MAHIGSRLLQAPAGGMAGCCAGAAVCDGLGDVVAMAVGVLDDCDEGRGQARAGPAGHDDRDFRRTPADAMPLTCRHAPAGCS